MNLSRFLLALIFIAGASIGCRKTPPAEPPSLETGTVTITEPLDSAYFPLNVAVELTGSIRSNVDDPTELTAAVGVRNPDASTTFAGATISKDGTIKATLTNLSAPGVYRLNFVVNNPYNATQSLQSDVVHVLVGNPHAVQITAFTTDDTSITVHWSKSNASNFQAYELYATRRDLMPPRNPPIGSLVARITDRNIESYKHNDVFIYHRYNYTLRVVTDQDLFAYSERKESDAGSFIPVNVYPDDVIYDAKRTKMYFPDLKLKVVDPQTLTVEDSIEISDGRYINYLTMNSSGDALDGAVTSDNKNFQIIHFDINSGTLSYAENLVLPNNNNEVMAMVKNTVLYRSFINNKSVLVAQNITTNDTQIVRRLSIDGMEELSNDRLYVKSYDSLFIFQADNNNRFSLLHSEPGELQNGKLAHESSAYIAAGTKLYDQSFNLVGTIDPGSGDNSNYFMGIDATGTLAVTKRDQVLSLPGLQVLRTYGDGFGSIVFFSNDNNTLYHIAGPGWSVGYQPPIRLFRFPWR